LALADQLVTAADRAAAAVAGLRQHGGVRFARAVGDGVLHACLCRGNRWQAVFHGQLCKHNAQKCFILDRNLSK
jgi:hypothetical protein